MNQFPGNTRTSLYPGMMLLLYPRISGTNKRITSVFEPCTEARLFLQPSPTTLARTKRAYLMDNEATLCEMFKSVGTNFSAPL